MKKIIIILIILIVIFPGCINNNEEKYNVHTHYEMTIIPCNQTNESSTFEIRVPFIFPKEDPDYYLNKTIFIPKDITREVVIVSQHEGAGNYLKIVGNNQSINFILDKSEDSNKWNNEYLSSIKGTDVLVIFYIGCFEYLEIKYYTLNEGPDYSTKITAEVNTYQQGWNYFNTTIEDETWEE